MKRMTLDQDDRRALAALGSYLLLLACVLLGVLALSVTITLIVAGCVRLFTLVV